jgi:lipoprotein-anchoring transpeptidase ErfK/SrfK
MRYNKFMQKIFVLTLCFFTNFIFSEELRIEIDISKQRLYVIQNNTQTHSFAISSSKYGEGSEVNSFKTPLGKHSVRTMIGENAPKNTIFISRINTRRQADIIDSHIDSSDDYVTSRIIWLTGEEPGLNSGEGIDSYNRYIYIHGTHEEGLIGIKASHGCIRMFNDDVIKLYSMIKKGTKVDIFT